MATIKEIAKACNVSVATVSNILNKKPGASEATRRLVLETAKEMDYMPNYVAKNLRMRNTRSIGVIAEDMTIFSIPDIIDGITEFCEKAGYQILLINLRLYKKYNDTYYFKEDHYELIRQEIRKLIAKQVDGIIYVTAHERVLHCIPEDLPIPAVMAYGFTGSGKVPSIGIDDRAAAYELVQHLIDSGHRRIGVLGGKSSSIHAQNRLIGYQEVLRDNKLLYDPGIVNFDDWTRESGYNRAKQLIDEGVTAIFCMNDLIAGGVYDKAEELGLKIPDDISVVGYDNREVSSYYKPPLTSVDISLNKVGYKAAEVMIDLLKKKIEEQDEPRVYNVPCEKVIRRSVKRI